MLLYVVLWLFLAMSFKCKTGNIDVINGGYSPGNDAYYYANAVYDAYLEYYGIPPLKGTLFVRYVVLVPLTYCYGPENKDKSTCLRSMKPGERTFVCKSSHVHSEL